VTSDTAAFSLLSALAVRERARRMLNFGLAGMLPSFHIDPGRLGHTVDLVVQTTKRTYPSLDIPFHSRWRHFTFHGVDRWAALAEKGNWKDAAAQARAAMDLAIVSVLLDAGSGPRWRYHDPATEEDVGRSEGLGLASLAMFARGAFSSDPANPLQADATGLMRLSDDAAREGLQVSGDNPLVGIEGRAELLRRLGALIASKPDVFGRGDTPRPGGLFDHFATLAVNGGVAAPTILSELLRHLGPVWPSRLTLDGIPLGDCWRHPSLTTTDATNGLVPLHKLSQWMAYSLIEPLQAAGIAVSDINGLTGLAEYRNGGLFIDTGVLTFRDPADAAREHDVASTLVVEWRALTVALLDRLADGMRRKLGMDETTLPLAKVLEGGTWAAGRAAAREKRADGASPVKVISDGTVF
jgi:hypothetical protein